MSTLILDRKDQMFLGFIVLLLIFAGFCFGMSYQAGKTCDKMGGVSYHDRCVKTDGFIQID